MDVEGYGLGLSPPVVPPVPEPALRSTRPGFQPASPMPLLDEQVLPGTAFNLVQPSEAAVLAVVATGFDANFYLAVYPDVAAAGVDPLQHFVLVGAGEGRNPTSAFDTREYLAANPDVLRTGWNPFWHYLVQGRGQGRPPRRLHASQKQAFRTTRAEATVESLPAVPMACLLPGSLRDALDAGLANAAGVVLSVSHDRYTRSVGGVQILVSDEQLAFNAQGVAYLHIAPVVPRLALALEGEPCFLHVTLDGGHCGTTTYADLEAVLVELRPRLPAMRRLVLHCLLGHQPAQVTVLHAALAPGAAVFWVNDYEAICPGYNLLRNGVEFCGAPPPDSMACRVCLYGPARAGHLRQMDALFAAVPLHVVAPSPAALQVWRDGARLPHRSAQVHAYAALVPPPVPAVELGRPAAALPGRQGPVRVAFAGLPLVHKGWPGFAALAARLHGMPEYKLFHFTAEPPSQPLPGVELVPARVSPGQRGAMTDALRAHGIDLVLVLSPWPETFCLVAHEALAAGADLVTLHDSGNVPDLVLHTGRGVVAADMEAVLEFFLSGGAVRYAALAGAVPRPPMHLASRGMTSTLPDAVA